MRHDPIDTALERGMHNRRQILGDTWVERSLNNSNNFNAEFQNLITRFAWHEIWGRPGLDKKTRRVIVLATTMAMGRWEEFELHVRAALLGAEDTRLTPDELKEVLIQGAIYAGVPAANTGFTHALAILREIGPQIGYALAPLSPRATCHPGVGHEGSTLSTPHLRYSVRAPAGGGAPHRTIVLSHALGCDQTMWDPLANDLTADLATRCRVITYDQRGHAGSEAPPAPYTMAELADDAARLLRELDSGPVIWVGLSMGGMVGQELALRHPTLVAALVVANSTSAYPETARAVWRERIATVETQGIEPIADAVMARYFDDDFRAAQPATVARYRQRLVTSDITGYLGCCAAVSAIDTTDRLAQMAIPTLIIAGERDMGAPVAMSETLASAIPGAQLVVLQDASHLSVIEQPLAFRRAIVQFLEQL